MCDFTMLTKESIMETLKKCNDPEIQMDIVTLELIYEVKVDNDEVYIKMTFTTPMCPYGPMLIEDVKAKVLASGAKAVEVEVVFEPPWQPSEDLRAMMGV